MMNVKANTISIVAAGCLLTFTTGNNSVSVETEVDPIRKIEQTAFKKGEFLRFDVSYGVFDTAEATLEIKKNSKKIAWRNTMHIVGKGWSKGALSWFFKVEDRYETYMDEEAILPWKFIRHVREGGYKLDRDINFNHYSNKATVFQNDKKETKEHNMIVDMERNDLSKICKAGSVKISRLKYVEEYKHLFHCVSEIKGKLKKDIKVKDIIKAMI